MSELEIIRASNLRSGRLNCTACQYPNLPLLMFWIFCCLFASWAVAVVIYQNIEDRS